MSSAPAPHREDPASNRSLTEEVWAEVTRQLKGEARPEPAAETDGPNRRGPFRPGRLVPLRSRLEGRAVSRLFRSVDAGGIVAIAVTSAHLATAEGFLAATVASVAPFALAAMLLIWSLGALNAYSFAQREGLVRHTMRVTAAFGLTGLLLLAALTALPRPLPMIEALGLWFCMSYAGMFLTHGIWWALVRGWRKVGRLTPNIVVVGATAAAERLIRTALKTREVNVLGVFDDRIGRAPKEVEGVPVLGDTNALIGHKVMPYVDRVVITVTSTAQARVRELVDRLKVLPNEVSLIVDTGSEQGRAAALSRIADAPLARVSGEPADARRALAKQAQDLVVGTVALILSLPIMAVIAVAIRMDSPGPIFFRQRRHGFNNEEILVWKFRSMRQEAADHAAVRQVSYDDDRITRVGRFIRRTSLDELPQLFNVLKGEMSLVGPRPHAIGMKTGQTESARLVAEYAHRHRMKPGMTGWAAIHGSRGPVDTPELVKRRVALDIEYIERQGFWLDLYIMAMTIPCLLGDSDTVR